MIVDEAGKIGKRFPDLAAMARRTAGGCRGYFLQMVDLPIESRREYQYTE
jgi:hypothetical protein